MTRGERSRRIVITAFVVGAGVSAFVHVYRDHTRFHSSLEHIDRPARPVTVTETDTAIVIDGAEFSKTSPLVTFDNNGRKLRLDASGLWVPVPPEKPEAAIYVKASGDHTDRGWVEYSASDIQIPLQGVGGKFDDIFDRVVSKAPGTPAITCGVTSPEGWLVGSVGDIYIRDLRGFQPCQVGDEPQGKNRQEKSMGDDNHVFRLPDIGWFYSGESPKTLLHIKPDVVIQAGNVAGQYQGQPPSERLVIPVETEGSGICGCDATVKGCVSLGDPCPDDLLTVQGGSAISEFITLDEQGRQGGEIGTPQAIDRMMPNEAPLTVRWLGRVTYTEMMPQSADVIVLPYTPVEGDGRIDGPIANITSDPTVEIGLRSDGVVVWRQAQEDIASNR